MYKRLFRSATLVLVTAAFFMGCGLQDYEYLYPPSESSTGTLIAFTHNTANSTSDFRGYEVYYKIYLTSDTTSPPAAASDAAKIEASWSTVYPDQVIKRIKDAGYVGIAASSSTPVTSLKTPPLVTIANADVSKLVQASINLLPGTMTVTVPGLPDTVTSYYVARKALEADGKTYRSFSDFTASSTDCDTTSGSHFWIRAYAFGYGLDSNFAEFFGLPCVVADTVPLN
jgi:hypothetical protein